MELGGRTAIAVSRLETPVVPGRSGQPSGGGGAELGLDDQQQPRGDCAKEGGDKGQGTGSRARPPGSPGSAP